MTLFSAHRSFELNKRFAPDQRSAICLHPLLLTGAAPADISKVLIKFLLRLCSYTIYSVVKYRPTPFFPRVAAWAAMSLIFAFTVCFARDGARTVEPICSLLGANC